MAWDELHLASALGGGLEISGSDMKLLVLATSLFMRSSKTDLSARLASLLLLRSARFIIRNRTQHVPTPSLKSQTMSWVGRCFLQDRPASLLPNL